MSDAEEFVIPESHWEGLGCHDWRPFIPGWERQLRRRIAIEPDPAKRFTEWLVKMAESAGYGMPVAKLIFFEQPYLEWAQLIERTVTTAEKQLRQQISYEVANPDRDD